MRWDQSLLRISTGFEPALPVWARRKAEHICAGLSAQGPFQKGLCVIRARGV